MVLSVWVWARSFLLDLQSFLPFGKPASHSATIHRNCNYDQIQTPQGYFYRRWSDIKRMCVIAVVGVLAVSADDSTIPVSKPIKNPDQTVQSEYWSITSAWAFNNDIIMQSKYRALKPSKVHSSQR